MDENQKNLIKSVLDIKFPDGLDEDDPEQLIDALKKLNERFTQAEMAKWIGDSQPNVSAFLKKGTGNCGKKFFKFCTTLYPDETQESEGNDEEKSENGADRQEEKSAKESGSEEENSEDPLDNISNQTNKLSINNNVVSPKETKKQPTPIASKLLSPVKEIRISALYREAEVASINEKLDALYHEFEEKLIEENKMMATVPLNEVDKETKLFAPPLARPVLNARENRIPKVLMLFLGPSSDVISKRVPNDKNWHPFKVDGSWSKAIGILNTYLEKKLKLAVSSFTLLMVD